MSAVLKVGLLVLNLLNTVFEAHVRQVIITIIQLLIYTFCTQKHGLEKTQTAYKLSFCKVEPVSKQLPH